MIDEFLEQHRPLVGLLYDLTVVFFALFLYDLVFYGAKCHL